ncbi:putative receptor-like protein kinase At3g47110 [Actinidia eriantha]|uniref:putative receptor-like protein kinase At3g47110 n=1 Tax=Actinidia eriantha TaxID=165200 RepID=UPI00258F2F88|nr:putative receptor-like protein kinase At3g47110 [Actinidia eriantha]
MKNISFRFHCSYTIFTCIALCLCLTSLRFPSVAALSSGNETDRQALLAFKDSITEDPLGVISSWNSTVHFCEWAGVSCSNQHPGRVTVLNLERKKLAGTIPPHLGNLSFLRGINLRVNSFRGTIPQELGLLSRLRYLNLSQNAFQGEIPSNLSYCSNLQVIDLSYNNLVGEIPDELSVLSMEKLTGFGISVNNLTGNIPIWLGNASSLIKLSMGENNFQGSIPTELGRLSKLQLLQIAGNNLSGTVPPSIYNLSSLLYLDIGDNRLYGRIPLDIGFTLPNLLGLYVGQNQFTGLLPVSLSNASELLEINFAFSKFTGTVPPNLGSLKGLQRFTVTSNLLGTGEAEDFSFLTSLTNCSNLKLLDIGLNNFTGELPASIGNLSTTLEYLVAGTNQISGSIPEGITNLLGLTMLVISKNSLKGEIPASIGKLEKLVDLRLFDNKISGAIPASLGNITQLRRLYLHTNNLSGNIPPSLGNCRQLELLRLFSNNLTGFIPKEVGSLSWITLSFNFAHNSLTGPLPTEIGNMSKLTELNVSNNKLSGEIPSTIAKCLMLERLDLEGNLFEGRIPPALSILNSLQFFDLSRNNLFGQIPVFLQNFTLLQNLNLSFNNFEGEVPQGGIFRNTSAFSVVGNQKLCGGIKNSGLPACEIPVAKKTGTSLAVKIAIPVAISCVILLACSMGYLCRRKRPERIPSSMLPVDEQFRKISYAELLQATNGFSSSNLIGEGSYGSVYKGILGSDGMAVAVKIIKLTEKGAAKSFVAECNALRSIRHRNLIKIITTCSSIDSKGDDFKALIFEFMPNGSLEEWLHLSKGEQENSRSLSLVQRLSIAIDVASALEYLHHHSQAAIIHGDLKPSNILIDHHMTAHVGDFGLARFLSDSLPTSSEIQTRSTGIRGTVGYVAPEYGMGSKASTQGDVYSFGILLLEMFTGRRPTDSIFNDSLNLHQFSKMALPERVTEIVEPSVLLEVGGNDNHVMGKVKTEECLVAVLTIGVSCSKESSGERMDMRDVVAELCMIRNKVFTE